MDVTSKCSQLEQPYSAIMVVDKKKFVGHIIHDKKLVALANTLHVYTRGL